MDFETFYSPLQFYRGLNIIMEKAHLIMQPLAFLQEIMVKESVNIFSSIYLNTLFHSSFGIGIGQVSYSYTVLYLVKGQCVG